MTPGITPGGPTAPITEGVVMSKLDGQVAVVTGGGQGIGAATVRRLAEDGAHVVALDLDLDNAEKAVADLPRPGLALACDVTDRAQVRDAVARTVERFGRIDVLVNNAGVTRDALVHKMTDAEWDLVIATHLTGGFHVTQAVQEHMVANRYGRIVFLSSRAALGNRGQINYSAAKAGLQGMARTLAIELGRFGITVNTVAPGFVETAMTRAIIEKTGDSWENLVAAMTERAAVKRTGKPEDIAAVISFLSSPDSGFVTGQTIYATGSPAV
jgi:3-oxoacyl-[acyl-carrier protein] reductase